MHELTAEQETKVQAFIVDYLANLWVSIAANSNGLTLDMASDFMTFNDLRGDELFDAIQAYMQTLKIKTVVFEEVA